MREYVSLNRQIPLAGEYDVIVVGGGPAGAAASIAAARQGAKVLLLESTWMLGGMGTAGLVPAWCPFSDKEKPIYRGIAWEVFQKSWTELTHPDPEVMDWVPIDSERLKLVYDELVTGAGVDVRFGSSLAAVLLENERRISSIVSSGKDGLLAWRAPVYIDCTGDGDLAVWAGASFDTASEFQPASSCFQLSGVNESAYIGSPSLHTGNPSSPIHRIVAEKHYPLLDDSHFCQSLIRHETVGFNAGHIKLLNPYSSASLSKTMLLTRRLAMAYRDALSVEIPEIFAGAELASTPALPCVRESRRIHGEYTFTYEDYSLRRSFEDEIGRNCYYIDVHGCTGVQKIPRYGPGESHGIPYRSLVVKSLDNLLMAGRCISSDRPSNGSLRVMPVCLVTGQAAGVAAALLSRSQDIPAREIETAKLRQILRENGAWFY